MSHAPNNPTAPSVGATTETAGPARALALAPCSAPRWKPMDVAYGENIRRPRRLVLEVDPTRECARYTCCTEGQGESYDSEHSLMTFDEWLTWLDKFSDDLTGRELREAREAVRETFTEPPGWRGFRERFATTGDPWLK